MPLDVISSHAAVRSKIVKSQGVTVDKTFDAKIKGQTDFSTLG